MNLINTYHKLNTGAPSVLGRKLFYAPVKPVQCKDGFRMSVQAGEYLYSSPREAAAWPYTAFEVGFPSEAEPLLMEYAEDPDRPTDTVYGYVPANVIEAVIAKHGGLKTIDGE
jgi:hypothetical protein